MHRSWLIVVLHLAFLFVFAAAERFETPHALLRPRFAPISIPIRRDLSRNTTVSGNGTNPLSNSTVSGNRNITSGLTGLTLSGDRQSYYTIIQVGGIPFRVVLDTASSDLWLASSSCSTVQCKNIPRYPLAYQSPTFVPVNANSTAFHAGYADGSVVSGFVAKESVSLADLMVANQSFGVVTDSNVTLTDQTSGIFGLGFPRLSSISQVSANSTTFFASLAETGLLAYPLFAFNLGSNSSGTLTLGAIDSSVVTNASRINWNKVAEFPPFAAESNTSTYLQWAIPLDGILVNGTVVKPIPTYPQIHGNSSLALFDIGTSGIFGPFQDVARIFSLIAGARLVNPNGQWVVPCDTTIPLALTFGNQNYTLQPSDYIIGPASGNPNLCLSWPVALPPSADGVDWQIGEAFLRTVYSIFTFGINTKESPMIGLYPLTSSSNVTQSAESVSSFLSAISATIPTTLPNFLLPTPTFSTPPYALNSSVPAPIGAVVSSGLATSTYAALLGKTSSFNASAVPTVSPSPSVVTFTLTDLEGQVTTTVSTQSIPAITLGIPPGWNGGSSLHVSFVVLTIMVSSIWTLLCLADFVI